MSLFRVRTALTCRAFSHGVYSTCRPAAEGYLMVRDGHMDVGKMTEVMTACTALLVLAGCASFPLTVAGECRNLGYVKGTEAFAACKADRKAIAIAAGDNAQRNLLTAGGYILQGALNGMNNPNQAIPAQSPMGLGTSRTTLSPIGTYKYEWVTGANRVCTYQTSKGYFPINIPVTKFCPRSIP